MKEKKRVAVRTWNGLALCAGIGGLELGARDALGGHLQCVGYVERDSFAASVLVGRMEEQALDPAPVYDDLATFDGRHYRGKVDLVLAGFPCQPASLAGSRQGRSDERWLWPQIEKIIADVQPYAIVLENVRGLLSVDHGRGFLDILASLARLGFDAEWMVFGARDVGAPHKRERVFVLAWRGVPDPLRDFVRHEPRRRGGARGPSAREPRDVGARLADPGESRLARRKRRVAPRAHAQEVAAHGSAAELRAAHVADADGRRQQDGRKSKRGEHEGTHGSVVGGCGANGGLVWPPAPNDREGWKSWLDAGGPPPALEPGVRGDPDGIPAALEFATDRLRALGNAVVPAQAEAAIRLLAARALA